MLQDDPINDVVTQCGAGSEVGLEAKVGRRFSKWLSTSLFTRVHDEVLTEKCFVDYFLPPPPDSGVIISRDYSDVLGYPYVSSGIRFTLSAALPDGSLVRAYGGGEWVWNKSLVAPLYGFGMAFPARDWLMVAELERRFLKVPYDELEATYRGGRLVDFERTRQESKAYRWAIRLGVERQAGKRR